MSSSYGATSSANAQALSQDFAVDGFDDSDGVIHRDVVVRMAVPNRPMCHLVDDGEDVELYVTFAEGVEGERAGHSSGQDDNEVSYKVDLAGEPVLLKPVVCFKCRHSTMYKATATVTSTQNRHLSPGEPVPFSLQYHKGDTVGEVCEVTDPNMPVYYQPVWKKLLERDDCLIKRINEIDRSDTYPTNNGNIGGQQGEKIDEDDTDSDHSRESDPLLTSYTRSTTPTLLAEDDFFLYYTRRACRPFLESENPLIKFIREVMVTPLTNFTGLSLYYQLYLVEIFHVKFVTKLGHYLCMPMIVLLIATWCAQWRYIGHYRIEDVSIFIVNGTLAFLIFLQVWYLVWGALYKMYLFGIFMVWPLFFIYMLSNMLFQIIVIKSYWVRKSDLTVKDVREEWGIHKSHWYDIFTLEHFGVQWYLNPLLWALFFSCLQAISHTFEEKLPPRVSQTAHWLDLTTILRQNGYVHFAQIIFCQAVCGTLNELCASPRLLPLLLLRICYSLGYEEKQWVKFRMLVDECLKFGDPAIDYIGQGGAKWPKKFKTSKPSELEEQVKTLERGIPKKKRELLKDPAFLRDDKQFSHELQFYVMLRHRLAKYKIQVAAYGPFTPAKHADSENPSSDGALLVNDRLMDNDFPDDPAFKKFLVEARAHFAEMEYRFVQKCKLKRAIV